MRDGCQWIPFGGLVLTIAIAVLMPAQLLGQKAPAGDYSKAAVAEVRDAQGQVILRGSFSVVDETDDEDIERKATLAPAGADADAEGEAEVEVAKATPADQEIEFAIRNVQASTVFVFVIDGKEILRVTSDRRGRAEADLQVATAPPTPTR